MTERKKERKKNRISTCRSRAYYISAGQKSDSNFQLQFLPFEVIITVKKLFIKYKREIPCVTISMMINKEFRKHITCHDV